MPDGVHGDQRSIPRQVDAFLDEDRDRDLLRRNRMAGAV
jgi:hypothetical protein